MTTVNFAMNTNHGGLFLERHSGLTAVVGVSSAEYAQAVLYQEKSMHPINVHNALHRPFLGITALLNFKDNV